MTHRRLDLVRLAGLLGVVVVIAGSWVLIVWGVRWLLDTL